jgi:flavin reductase (DIM6/NTAB) family NADH-FMN oxidoreductase RutF
MNEQMATVVRHALRRLAKAVTIITVKHAGQRYAMVATAVSEVSMDPPSMLVCVNKSASLHAPLSGGANFCINILHNSHSEISSLCSGSVKGEPRFAKGNWSPITSDIPRLLDAQASLVCKNERFVEFGTHGIFLGTVLETYTHGDVDPLVYVDGKYGSSVVDMPSPREAVTALK